jgi:hypothetical protein
LGKKYHLRSERFYKYFSVLITVCLAAIAILQAGIVYKDYAKVWLSRTVRTYYLSSMERNTLFLYGSKGAQFIKFISSAIAFNEPVIMPSGYDIFSEQSLLQFFLFPRAIIGCPCSSFLQGEEATEECKTCLLDPDRSVISMGGFPPEGLLNSTKEFMNFQDSTWYHGLFVPLTASQNDDGPFILMETPLIKALLIDLTLLGLLFLLGALIVFNIDQRLSWTDVLTLSVPIGAGCLTFALFLVARLGVRITLGSYLAVMLAIFVCCLSMKLVRKRKLFPDVQKINPNNITRSIRRQPWVFILIAGVMLVAGVIMIISVICGHSSFDGIANWVLKGYAIAETGSVTAGSRWGGHGLSYPQNIHLLVALFRLADGDVVPGSKLLFPIYFFSLLLGCFGLWNKYGVRKEFSLLGVLCLSSTPIIFEHATLSWANLPFSVYLVLGVFYLIDAIKTQNKNKIWISGILSAAAVWTRPEGIGYALIIGLVLVVMVFIRKIRKSVIISCFAPSLLVILGWMTFSYKWMAGDEIGTVITNFIPALVKGDIRPGLIGQLLTYAVTRFASIGTWGFLFWIIIILLIGGAIRMRKTIPMEILTIFITALLFLLIPLFMFYVAGFNMDNPSVFLSVSFDRAQFHGAALLLTAAMVASLGNLAPVNLDKGDDKSHPLSDNIASKVDQD